MQGVRRVHFELRFPRLHLLGTALLLFLASDTLHLTSGERKHRENDPLLRGHWNLHLQGAAFHYKKIDGSNFLSSSTITSLAQSKWRRLSINEQQTNASTGAELEQQDAQRTQANAQGQQNVPGEAGRAQVGSKDPKGESMDRTCPSKTVGCVSRESLADTSVRLCCSPQNTIREVVQDQKDPSLCRIRPSKQRLPVGSWLQSMRWSRL